MVTERLLADELESKPYVKYVTSLANTLPEGIPESFVPESLKSQLHTKNYARILMSLKTSSESDLAFNSIIEISAIVKSQYPDDSYIVGTTPSTMDIKNVIVDDWTKIDKLSMLGVALAIMLAFRSLALPLVLMIPIQMAIFVNMTFPYLLGNQIMFMGYVIVSCLQLGATIDYSIVMSHHYLAWRKKTDKVTASINATADSILPILTSGLILAVAGFGVSFLSSVQAIADLGMLIGRGAILSTFMVITLLPNLFIWTDRFIVLKSRKQTGVPKRNFEIQKQDAM
jgi:predicted RND superfamily exporter protein